MLSLTLLMEDQCCVTCQQMTKQAFSYPGYSLGLWGDLVCSGSIWVC